MPVHTLAISIRAPLYLRRALMECSLSLEAWSHFLSLPYKTPMPQWLSASAAPSLGHKDWFSFFLQVKVQSVCPRPPTTQRDQQYNHQDQLEKLVQGEPSHHLCATHWVKGSIYQWRRALLTRLPTTAARRTYLWLNFFSCLESLYTAYQCVHEHSGWNLEIGPENYIVV